MAGWKARAVAGMSWSRHSHRAHPVRSTCRLVDILAAREWYMRVPGRSVLPPQIGCRGTRSRRPVEWRNLSGPTPQHRQIIP